MRVQQRRDLHLPVSSRGAAQSLAGFGIATALAALILNDWVWKPMTGGSTLTGKLSDVAGLFLVPFVVGATCHAMMNLGVSRAVAGGAQTFAVCLTGVCFVAAKTSAVVATQLADLWPWPGPTHVVADPTDVVALPFLALGTWAANVSWRSSPS